MSALPLTTPQMRCPTCRQIVAITKSGTVKQHSRMVSTVFSFRSRAARCPSSFTKAPDGAHAAYLRSVIEYRQRSLQLSEQNVANARHHLEATQREEAIVRSLVAEATAALEEVSQ